MRYYVYVLRSPRSGAIRYVGITYCPEERLRTHLKNRDQSGRGRWIENLHRLGLVPVMTIKAVVSGLEEAKRVEVEYIVALRKHGHKLVNGTGGGDGGLSPESIRRLSESLKVAWKKESRIAIHRQIHVGKKRSEDTRAKISAGKRGAKWTEEQKARHSERLRGSWTPERRAAAIAYRTGRKMPEIHRLKLRAYWTPEMRAAFGPRMAAARKAKHEEVLFP